MSEPDKSEAALPQLEAALPRLDPALPRLDPALPRRIPLLIFAWLWVAVPFAYGLDRLIVNLLKLFQ